MLLKKETQTMHDPKPRSSGILLHITSLPNEYGIGDLGPGAYQFIDFLKKSGQKNWQILPLGMTGYGGSPYQCFSAFAGNPYLISIDDLLEKNYLSKEIIQKHPLYLNPEVVNYDLIYENKMKLLRISYDSAKKSLHKKLQDYYQENKQILRDFVLYMSLRTHYRQKPHFEWDKDHQDAYSKSVDQFEKTHTDEVFFWIYTQYIFSEQWKKLKRYANSKNISIIGDIPFYVSMESSDIWANPSFFKLDKQYLPKFVAGCPPDFFSEKGQLWGNPVYHWRNLKKDDYQWWIRRIRHNFSEVDILRIDHFRGFESFWQVKYGADDASVGKWIKGPGYEFFKKIQEELGKQNIIAEDLGLLTDDVHRLIQKTGYPGMKILQFAFSTEEESAYLPHNIERHCVVYTGTHDNNTICGWLKTLRQKDFDFARKYMKLDKEEGYAFGVIRTAWSSPAYLSIAPMQDFLNLDDTHRMNTPSTVTGNWQWRLKQSDLTDSLANKILELTKRYGR